MTIRRATCSPSGGGALGIGEPMRWPVGAEQTRIGQGVGIAPVGLHLAGTRRVHRREVRLSDDHLVAEAFESDDWPGNVRELEAVVKRAMVRRRAGWVTPGDIVMPMLRRLPASIGDAGGRDPPDAGAGSGPSSGREPRRGAARRPGGAVWDLAGGVRGGRCSGWSARDWLAESGADAQRATSWSRRRREGPVVQTGSPGAARISRSITGASSAWPPRPQEDACMIEFHRIWIDQCEAARDIKMASPLPPRGSGSPAACGRSVDRGSAGSSSPA